MVVHQHDAGQVHFGGYGRIAVSGLRHFPGIQRLGDFGVEPLLQLRVGGMFADFAADEMLFCVVDASVSLGGGDQGAQYRVAVGFDLRAGEQVGGLWQILRRGAGLAALPGLIRLVSHHAQRSERRVTGPAGTASATATKGASQATTAEQATE